MDEQTLLINQLIDALLDMVNQHCTDHRHNPPLIMTEALSSNENAIDLLVELGYLEQIRDDREWYRRTKKQIRLNCTTVNHHKP